MKILPKSKVTWILVLFIAYAYYTDYTNKHNVTAPPANTEEAQIQKEESLEDKVVNNLKKNDTAKVILEALVKKAAEDKYGKGEIREIAARETGKLAILDVIRGNGAELRCGATAVINYEAFMSNGIAFDSTKSKSGNSPIAVITGKNQVIKGLEAGIIGMREGGKRKISIPPGLAFSATGFKNNLLAKDEVISYNVELVTVKDGAYKNDANIESKSENEGTGNNILCGDKVKIRYSINNSDSSSNTKDYGDIAFIMGAGNVPIGFELAAANMKAGGHKTVVIPPQLLKTAGKSSLKTGIKLADNEPIVAEIEVIESSSN